MLFTASNLQAAKHNTYRSTKLCVGRVIFVKHRKYRIVKVIAKVNSTAYAPGVHSVGTKTYCGVKAESGVIAVDPKTIRLRSQLYVPGYGFGRALDTGKNIKGKRIDLCFTKETDALKYGRREVVVFVLSPV